jgi:hypothetical protein
MRCTCDRQNCAECARETERGQGGHMRAHLVIAFYHYRDRKRKRRHVFQQTSPSLKFPNSATAQSAQETLRPFFTSIIAVPNLGVFACCIPDRRVSVTYFTSPATPPARCASSSLQRKRIVILTRRISGLEIGPQLDWTTMKAFLACISALLNKCRRYLGVMPMWMAVPLRILTDILILTLVTLVVVLALYLLGAYLITGS